MNATDRITLMSDVNTVIIRNNKIALKRRRTAPQTRLKSFVLKNVLQPVGEEKVTLLVDMSTIACTTSR